MGWLGDVTKFVDLLGEGWSWWQDRRDPARVQAERFQRAFEAYGIARQQIVRLLPAALPIPASTLSRPDKLKDELTPALLDWAADFLALDRPWFDGVTDEPHHRIHGYKDETVYADWFLDRRRIAPLVDRRVFAWASAAPIVGNDGSLCLAYIEETSVLDGNRLCRYWLLSEGWTIAHWPCVASMLRVAKIARSLDIPIIGRLVPEHVLRKLESGRLFAPQVARSIGRLWYPEECSRENHLMDEASR